MNAISSLLTQWRFTRSETLEILKSLTNEQLQFKPAGEKWQPLFKQFICMISTQLTYTRSIEEGRIDFSWFRNNKAKLEGINRREDLLRALNDADKRWLEAVKSKGEDYKIKWPGFSMDPVSTIATLMSHERLHHGQIISYFTLAGFELPEKFKNNWAL